MERNPWQSDPEIVAARLEGVRGALRRAEEAGAPAYVLESYRQEIRRIERFLAEPQPEPRPIDSLSRQALIHAFKQGVEGQYAPGGAEIVGLDELVGLPLFLPDVPSGLPPDEVERLEAAARAKMFSEWVEILAGRWKLHEPHLQAALVRVAGRYSCSRADVKLRLVRLGLIETMAYAGEPWSGRIGSGAGSGKVEAVPKEAGFIGQLKWLAQEALERANRALEDEDEQVHRPNCEEELASDSGMADKAASPEDAIIAAESAHERLADVYEAARGKEAEKLDALLRHLHAGQDFTEARRRAAEDLGVKENAIDLTLSRLRKRFGL